MLGIRLANSLLEIHQGWIGDALSSTTITDTWVGVGEVFGELLIQHTVMDELDTVLEDFGTEKKKEELTHPMSTPKNITIHGGKQHP